MSKFQLKETVFNLQNLYPLSGDMLDDNGHPIPVTVRKLTQAERMKIIESGQVDKYMGQSMVASLGCVNPKMTFDEAQTEPSDVIEQIADKVMEISGMTKPPKKGDAEKQPNA